MYERAINGVLNKNMLLYFAYCDFEESRMKYEKVHAIYQKLLDVEDTDPTLVCALFCGIVTEHLIACTKPTSGAKTNVWLELNQTFAPVPQEQMEYKGTYSIASHCQTHSFRAPTSYSHSCLIC